MTVGSNAVNERSAHESMMDKAAYNCVGEVRLRFSPCDDVDKQCKETVNEADQTKDWDNRNGISLCKPEDWNKLEDSLMDNALYNGSHPILLLNHVSTSVSNDYQFIGTSEETNDTVATP